MSSVHASVSESVAAIMRASHEYGPQGGDYVQQVLAAVRPKGFAALVRRLLCLGRGAAPPVAEWCADPRIHTTHGISYGHLLQMVWTIITHHEHRDELTAILKDELRASIGVCFTGRFSRLVNVLNGFVDGISVGISSAEQMQATIAQVVRRGGEARWDADRLRKEVGAILDEFDVRDADARAAWLDALHS